VSELRWHPLLKEWVVIAAEQPEEETSPCPFCPGSGTVPSHYDVLLLSNQTAPFQTGNDPFVPDDGLYRATGTRGIAEFVLYDPNHEAKASRLDAGQWQKIVGLWASRYREAAREPDVRYIHIFEQQQAGNGHPRGEIYSFPFLPPLVQREVASAHEHYNERTVCAYCEILLREREDKARVVAENASFTAFVPFFSRRAGEVTLYARRHVGGITDLSAEECRDLAELLPQVRRSHEQVFGPEAAMIIRNPPAKGSHPYFHFHVDLYPLAGGMVEGSGTRIIEGAPEAHAEQLRQAAGAF
jgi:UDPglucose--hexose-1-phosphate uridylyltransferase